MNPEVQETQVINLDQINANELPELQGWKEKQEALVKENPFIEIIDNKTYIEGKRRRTNLVKGRTEIQGQDKVVASKLKEFRLKVGGATKELIEISITHEEKQQEEVKRYEAKKEEDRLEKVRLEEKRKKEIQENIESIFNEWKNTISEYDINTIQGVNIVEVLSDIDVEQFEEYAPDFNEKTRILTQLFSDKKHQLETAENQRLEALKLAEEKEKFAEEQRIAKEKLEKEEKERAEKQALIDVEKEKFEKEKAEYEVKKKAENFKFRKKRLLDLGFEYHEVVGDNYNFILKGIWSMFHEQVENPSDEGFEETINQINDAIERNNIKISEEKKAKEDAEKKAKIDAEKELKLEKARQKRINALKPDKVKLLKYIEELQFPESDIKLKDKKAVILLESIHTELAEFKDKTADLINQLD